MEADPTAMVAYCTEDLPRLLHEVGDVELGEARAVGADVLVRAESFAALDDQSRDVLGMPFLEEVYDHHPRHVSPTVKAAVALVVRSSLIEELHVRGYVDDAGIRFITTESVEPLAHLMVARRSSPLPAPPQSPFVGLAERYPRAWAVLEALLQSAGRGGRVAWRAEGAPIPDLPGPDEHVTATRSAHDTNKVIFSGIDPRFDQDLLATLQGMAEQPMVLFAPSLSRLSRNVDKQLRALEFMLAHGSSVLTTNYLLRPADVWTRAAPFVRPDSRTPLPGLRDTSRMAGTHRKVAQQIAAQFT